MCNFEGCDHRAVCKGYCTGHYAQQYQGRELTPLGSTKGGTNPHMCCLETDCTANLRSDNRTGYCTKHRHLSQKAKDEGREWYRRTHGVTEDRHHRNLVDHISGELPSEGEVSIYVLVRDEGVFYVGQSVSPVDRFKHHSSKLQEKDLKMEILRNVAEEDSVYWECKYIVEYTDQGCNLDNLDHASRFSDEKTTKSSGW